MNSIFPDNSGFEMLVNVRHLLNFSVLVPLCLLSPCHVWGEDPQGDAAGIAFFEKKIRPVLIASCYECHAATAKSIRGGLLLDSAATFRAGGDSGVAFVPGKPEEGTLLDALRHVTFEMPPSQKLPEQVIQDFQTWIEMGAPDPREGMIPHPPLSAGLDLEKGREFWSFRPLKQPVLPPVKRKEWSTAKIDLFLLAAQESQGLTPGQTADPLTLLRRVYFDLIGLPPTFEQILSFQQNHSEQRWEIVVDELLASPQFGERWGRHWLDLARFSESTGGGRSLLYEESWRYRNYVIESFQANKPFDQFVREQLAGDLMSADDYRDRRQQLIATGFLALGPHNYENQDKIQLQMDVVDEQIDTVGRVFLGMTIGCARCHDHKFDPIPTTDYYALAGIFRSTNSLVDGNVSRWVSTPLPLSPEEEMQQQLLASRTTEINQIKAEIASLRDEFAATVVDNLQAQFTGEWRDSTSVKGFIGENYRTSTDITATATYALPVEPGTYEVRISYTPSANRTKAAKVKVLHSTGENEFQINQQLAPNKNGTFHSLGEFVATETLTVIIQPSEPVPTIIDAVQLVTVTNSEEVDETGRATQKKLKQLNSRLNDLTAEIKTIEPVKPPQIVSVEEMKSPADFNVCIRGNVHNLGQPVPRGFLSVAMSSTPAEIPDTTSGRLELANWIASPENPLTARVFVNRVWQHLFGVGLVRTVDNFGVPGEAPSHPELLDYLALEFIQNDWSIKALIREIVLSRTYQLSSENVAVEESATDVENRLLTRQNRKRLEAETLHDALLSNSGELNLSPAERTVNPGTKSEYNYTFEYGNRAVYLPVFRNRLPEMFVVFDFPDPNLSQGLRTSSTISPQSLFLMNSDFVQDRSSKTAARVLTISDQLDERLDWLLLSTLNRYPNSDETRLFTEFLGAEPESLDRWTHICQAIFGSLDYRFVK